MRSVSTTAAELSEWFESVLRLTDDTLFSIAPQGSHRDAVVLDTLRRNARALLHAKSGSNGGLYSPLCFFLAAACRQLRVELHPNHWQAALENVLDLKQRLEGSRSEAARVGLEIGAPVQLFKDELGEAVRQAGLLDGATFLSKEDRQVALGLAVNWGIRLLLAYAAEVEIPDAPSDRKDLHWLAKRVSAALAESA